MKTIAENANDFADLRTRAKGDCIYVDYLTIKDYDDGIYTNFDSKTRRLTGAVHERLG